MKDKWKLTEVLSIRRKNPARLKNPLAVSFYHIYNTRSFLKEFIYLFLERGRDGERERNIDMWLPLTWPPLGIWPATQAWVLTENRTRDPLVFSSPVLNPMSYGNQGTIHILKAFKSYIHFMTAVSEELSEEDKYML